MSRWWYFTGALHTYTLRSWENSFLSLSFSVFLSSRVLCVSAPPPEERASHASGKPLHNGSPWFRGYLCRMRSFRSRSCVTRSNTISCHAGFHEIPARKTGLIGWRAITTVRLYHPFGNDVFACAFCRSLSRLPGDI